VSFGARARIRLGAIRQNLETVKAIAPGTRVMAIIKANAYGHGLIEVARTLDAADCLAVARLAEARALREAGINNAITVLGGALALDDYDEFAALELGVVVHDEQQIRWLEQCRAGLPSVWLKVDTGMKRLGVRLQQVPDALRQLRSCSEKTGLMTHFSAADETGQPETRAQLARFLPLAGSIEGGISVANSTALLGWGEELEALAGIREQGRLWIRPGLALYGVSPFAGRMSSDFGLKAAMQLEATLMSIKQISAGERVGYGGTWQARTDSLLGIVAAGYADGYSRYIPGGTPVLVNGRRVPVVGRISMDLTAVDLGADAHDRVGDTVVLWGDGLPVEEIAQHADTIPYQLLAGVTHRESCIFEEQQAVPANFGKSPS